MKKRIGLTLTSITLALIAGSYFFNQGTNPILLTENREKEEVKSPIPNDLWHEIRSYPDGFDETLFLAKMEEVKQSAHDNAQSRDADLTLPWIQEGPGNIGGRFNVIQQSPSNSSSTLYAGAVNGGLFKTVNNGQSWLPIFDDLAYLAIGCMAIDETNDNILYVGTGDKNFGGGSKLGNGIYRSGDAGTTWSQIGLEQTGIVTEVVLHPTNPDIIFAATLGNTYEKTNERGVYKTIDGGLTWNNVLFLSDSSGVMDLVMDPSDPDVLYASGYNRINLPYKSVIKGPESDVYKTTDGGNNWAQLTNGLPNTEESRVGLAIAASNPDTVYAIYVSGSTQELKDVYRSTDSGLNWAPLNVIQNGVDIDVHKGFGWYFGEVYVNPYNSDHIIIPGVDMFQTTNGGVSWSQNVPTWWTYEVHADKHDVLFLDATSYIIATDGGLYKTIDNGNTWTDIENIPVTQFYHIDIDPINFGIYGGGAQDNGTMSGSALLPNDWERIYGGDGFRMTYMELDPGAMYVETQRGNITYLDAFQGSYDVSPDLTDDRTNWDTPYTVNEDDAELFVGTSKVSLMEFAPYGSYQAISGDLTKVALGTSIGSDSRHTITEIEQSEYNSNLMMVGTSDGLVWKGERNSGIWSFTNVTASNLPDRYVTGIQSSVHSQNFYVSYSGYTLNDNSSYIYKTTDLGQNWVDISGDLPDVGVNDICLAPETLDNNIFVAVDGGVYFTANGGVNWDYVGIDLPAITARELKIDFENNKLICGTYSRSMYSYDISGLDFDFPLPVTVHEQTVNQVSVFPNPSSNFISIQYEKAGSLRIYDLAGQLMMEHYLTEKGGEIINLKDLSTGTYIYKLNGASGKFVRY
ncbi:MAG: T9SS type A sorting domain-containing protein [Crocinitomicaceae bacterium]